MVVIAWASVSVELAAHHCLCRQNVNVFIPLFYRMRQQWSMLMLVLFMRWEWWWLSFLGLVPFVFVCIIVIIKYFCSDRHYCCFIDYFFHNCRCCYYRFGKPVIIWLLSSFRFCIRVARWLSDDPFLPCNSDSFVPPFIGLSRIKFSLATTLDPSSQDNVFDLSCRQSWHLLNFLFVWNTFLDFFAVLILLFFYPLLGLAEFLYSFGSRLAYPAC